MTDDLLFKEQKLSSYYFIDIYSLKMKKKLYQMSKKDNEDTSMLFLVKFDTS